MFDRETMMLIAVIVTLAGTAYMFREFQKQKQEITNVKYYVSKKLSSPPKPAEHEEAPESADSDED